MLRRSPLSIVYIYLSIRELSHLAWATQSWHGRTKFLDLLWSPSTIHCNQPFPPPSQLFSLATQFTSEGLVSHTAQWWLLSQFCCLNIVIGLFLKLASIPFFLKRSSIDYILTLCTLVLSTSSVIGGVSIIAGLYLVIWARYNQGQRAPTDGCLDPLIIVDNPRIHKTQESPFV